MQRLGVEEWAHVLDKLPSRDAAALQLSSRALAPTLRRAQTLRLARSMQVARLVTILYTSGDPVVVVSTPSAARYSVGPLLLPRRLYAHAFPEVCLHAVHNVPRRIDSYLAFERQLADTLPLAWAPPPPPAAGMALWTHSRFSTPIHSADPHDWRAVLRIHARYHVGCRTGLPRRHRGRRARRWTKVSRHDARAVRAWTTACLDL